MLPCPPCPHHKVAVWTWATRAPSAQSDGESNRVLGLALRFGLFSSLCAPNIVMGGGGGRWAPVKMRGLDQPFYFPSQAAISNISHPILQHRQASKRDRPAAHPTAPCTDRGQCPPSSPSRTVRRPCDSRETLVRRSCDARATPKNHKEIKRGSHHKKFIHINPLPSPKRDSLYSSGVARASHGRRTGVARASHGRLTGVARSFH